MKKISLKQKRYTAFFFDRTWALIAWGGLLLITVLLALQTYVAILMNDWFKEFYDLLQIIMQEGGTDSRSRLGEMFLVVLLIASGEIVVGVMMDFVAGWYALAWREALTNAFIPPWLRTRIDIECTAQRIHNDLAVFADIVETVFIRLVRALMMLAVFYPVMLRACTTLGCNPLWIVLGVLGCTAVAMTISWFVSGKLPKLNHNSKESEAALRRSLELAEVDKKTGSRKVLAALFLDVRRNNIRLLFARGCFDLWIVSYKQAMVFAPFVIVLSGLFGKVTTWGDLQQFVNIFGQLQNNLSVILNNWHTITELRTVNCRVSELEKALEAKIDDEPVAYPSCHKVAPYLRLVCTA